MVVGALLVGTRRLIPFGLRPDWRLLTGQMRFGVKSYTQILAMHLLFRIDVYMVAYFLESGGDRVLQSGAAFHRNDPGDSAGGGLGDLSAPGVAAERRGPSAHGASVPADRPADRVWAGWRWSFSGPFMVPLWYGKAFAAGRRSH